MMRAVVLHVTDEALAERRRRGIDRFDEMWEGVLHMAPAPAYEHQRLVSDIDRFLGPLCERTGRGVLAIGINVFNESSAASDYRIPDFTFVAAGREQLLAKDGVRGGGPDAVIEIRSPDEVGGLPRILPSGYSASRAARFPQPLLDRSGGAV